MASIEQRAAARQLARSYLARAALLLSDPDAVLWPAEFTTEQIGLIMLGECDSRAHDSTCVAESLYDNFVEQVHH